MKKLLICDIDGTLRTTLSGDTFARHTRDYKLISKAEEKLKTAISEGRDIWGVSNQGGVAAGHKSLIDCINEFYYFFDLCPYLRGLLFCPDFQGERCFEIARMNIYHIKNLQDITNKNPDLIGKYRKPKDGMIQAILRREKLTPPFTSEEITMIGDRPEDEGAAKAADIPFMWASDWLK